MGREKQKVYLYDADGSYIQSYNSISDFSKSFNLEKNITHRRTHQVNECFYEFIDGRIASLSKIGRVGVMKYQEIKRSPYVGKQKTYWSSSWNGYRYELYDLDMDLIAEFKSDWHLKLLTGIEVHTKFHGRHAEQVKTRDGLIIKRLIN